jgi:hypothetical protein
MDNPSQGGHKNLLVQACFRLYKQHGRVCANDFGPEGFEIIRCKEDSSS